MFDNPGQEQKAAFFRISILGELFSFTPSPQIFFLDFYIYPLFILGFATAGMAMGGVANLGVSLAEIMLGFIAWTFIEYLAHRFLLHRVPLLVTLHELHHENQTRLVGTPTLASLVVMMMIVVLPSGVVLGMRLALLLSAGFMAGYLLYVLMHHWLHHWPSKNSRYLQMLKRQHALHHAADDDYNFGVTSPFWDLVFGTYETRKRR